MDKSYQPKDIEQRLYRRWEENGWFAHDGARAEIVDALSSVDCGRLLSDDDLRAEGVFFEDGATGSTLNGLIVERAQFGIRNAAAAPGTVDRVTLRNNINGVWVEGGTLRVVNGVFLNNTSHVCAYPTGASPYELMDMSGNVVESVNDWYQSDYYDFSPDSNPQARPINELMISSLKRKPPRL